MQGTVKVKPFLLNDFFKTGCSGLALAVIRIFFFFNINIYIEQTLHVSS